MDRLVPVEVPQLLRIPVLAALALMIDVGPVPERLVTRMICWVNLDIELMCLEP